MEKEWKPSKWPFLAGNLLLLAIAGFLVDRAPHPISGIVAGTCVALCAIGAIVGCLPFVLEYRAFLKIIEVNGLGTAVDQIQNLDHVSTQISEATSRWAAVQESVGGQAEKTATAAKDIADRMADEVRQFSAFMEKMNDSEKGTLRLEVEKLRRGETEWLHTLVRILDHIFALHTAAAQSGQPKVAEQITHFQSACRGVVRRLGLAVFEAEPGKPFDPKVHQLRDEEKPADDATVAATLAPGYTIQGRLLRPALVRLKSAADEAEPAAAEPVEVSETE